MKLIKWFLAFVQKHLTGSYNIPVGKKFLTFNKLGPVFTLAFIIAYLGQYKYELTWLMVIGYAMIILCLFGFSFYYIFPSRRQKLTRPNIKE